MFLIDYIVSNSSGLVNLFFEARRFICFSAVFLQTSILLYYNILYYYIIVLLFNNKYNKYYVIHNVSITNMLNFS